MPPFYRWYEQYQTGGPEALGDRPSQPSRIWNRIPDNVRSQIITLALEQSELSPRELAVRFTDTKGYFVSEATVYRLLKAHDLITSPAFIVMKGAKEFQDKTAKPNEMWQTDFEVLESGEFLDSDALATDWPEDREFAVGRHVVFQSYKSTVGKFAGRQPSAARMGKFIKSCLPGHELVGPRLSTEGRSRQYTLPPLKVARQLFHERMGIPE